MKKIKRRERANVYDGRDRIIDKKIEKIHEKC